MTTTQIELDTREKRYASELTRLPRLNLGALLLPPVWGPAHGQWLTILFYPLWLFADISFTNAVFFGGLAAALAVTVFLGTAALTVFFALTVGRPAYLRVADRVPLPKYLAREKVWAVVCAALALLFLALATWYNLAVRLPAGPGA
jgi:hypothetical protein